MRLHLLSVALFVISLPQLCWGQASLDELEQQLEENAAAAPPAAQAATPPPQYPAGSGILGLVADDNEAVGHGARVQSVQQRGPAAAAGLQRGDLITSINGRVIVELDDMGAVLSRLRPGDKVVLEVLQGADLRRVEVVLGAAPAIVPRAGPARLGVTAVKLTPEAKREFNLPVDAGALITAIAPGSPADQYGLPVGGLIVGMNRSVINEPGQLSDFLSASTAETPVEISFYEGDQLQKKIVRLAPAFAEPQGAGNHLEQLELLLGALPAAVPPPAAPQPAPADANAIRSRIEAMQAEILRLQESITELERQLPPE